MDPDLTVACVLRSGGMYNAVWVRKLRDGFARHLKAPHTFVCLSDVPVPCERIPLETDWPGWWAKIELFRPGLFPGPVLYCDLDHVCCGPLDALAGDHDPDTVIGWRDTYRRTGVWASNLMWWHADLSFLHADFAASPEALMAQYASMPRLGDQAFIAARVQTAAWQDILPPGVVEHYGQHSDDVAMLLTTGRPKPQQITHDPIVSSNWI